MTLAQAKAPAATSIDYGVFINAVINSLIVAFGVLPVVRQAKRKQGSGATT